LLEEPKVAAVNSSTRSKVSSDILMLNRFIMTVCYFRSLQCERKFLVEVRQYLTYSMNVSYVRSRTRNLKQKENNAAETKKEPR
jgi:hypothetical protein